MFDLCYDDDALQNSWLYLNICLHICCLSVQEMNEYACDVIWSVWLVNSNPFWFLFLWWDQLASPYPLFVRHSECFTRYKINFASLCLQTSVATKIENGPQTNTKILWFLKMDQRRIRRIFVYSKILRRSSKIANSSNIFEDTKIFQGIWKIFVVKIFFQAATWTNFPSRRT